MLTARMGLAAAVVNNKIYAIGGNNISDLAVNEEYNFDIFYVHKKD
jgi:hypothetical protein